MIPIILASKSPRRKTILEKNGYQVTVDVSHADEHSVKEKNISKLVVAISELKAKTVAKRHAHAIIVAADTLVYFNGKEIGQQHTDEDARKTLKELCGKTHEVYTGMTVINTGTGIMLQDNDVSKVTLKNVANEVLEKYIRSGQYKGKAGAYNIYDPEFECFVENIKGNEDNIGGLPFKKIDFLIKRAMKE